MNRKMTPAELEQLIHRELRSLPPRRAPRSLESRVMAAIEHRATVVWYHQSWSYWPAAVRTAFLVVATGLAGAIVTAISLMSRGLDAGAAVQQAGSRFPLAAQLYAAGAWTADLVSHLVGSIPALWLYGGLATVAALYATFFGLGAAAYRTLYRSN
ncbi:MAG: hypothetical protein HYV95_17820 [Opitutae bacterium]|nr:hypothetical protein [Opitutae bacterium]